MNRYHGNLLKSTLDEKPVFLLLKKIPIVALYRKIHDCSKGIIEGPSNFVMFWKLKHRKILVLPFLAGFFYILHAHLKKTNAVHEEVWSLNGSNVPMDDPKLVQELRQKFLVAPVTDVKYKLSHPEVVDPSMGQGEVIRSFLKGQMNGFFIEVGALDGETRSNTLYFERFLGWKGLLIEPDPLNFADLLRINRKAWLSQSCVSVKKHPEIVRFEQNRNMGKIVNTGVNSNEWYTPSGVVNAQCFPLYTYLLALNVTQVDYFSLDVEGVELDVLKTIPFELVDIRTMSVEFAHVPGGKEAIQDFVVGKGYQVYSEVTRSDWLANDIIFVKSDLIKPIPA